MTDLADQLVQAWRTNQRVNVRLIESISDEGLVCTLSKRGGRDVSRQFAHLHNVRIYHLEKRAKKLVKGLRKFATEEHPDREELLAALEASAQRIEEFLRMAVAGTPGVRGFKRGMVQQLAYFVSHESHHRGNILLTLKTCGHPVAAAVRNGIWDWDRI